MSHPSILIVTNRVPYPLNDGGNLAMYQMAKGYHNVGWKVFLFSMNTSRHFIEPDSLPIFFREIIFEPFEMDTNVMPLSVLKNFLFSTQPNHAERFFNKKFQEKLVQITQSFQPDIIQFESIFLATYFNAIRHQSKALIIIRLHNIEYQIWEGLANESKNFFKKYYLKILAQRIQQFEKNAWQEADVLLPITQRDANVVQQTIDEENCIVVPFGVTISSQKSDDEEQWNAYHIGAMDWAPNADGIKWFLEKSFPKIHQLLPDFQFHFAGRNMPDLFKAFNSNGVVCAGEVADANAFISNKKILIVPLFSAGGIRVKILEAMAAEKLIIATPTAMKGIDDAVAGKHFLQAETADDFCKQIVWTLQHKEEASKIAMSGKVLIETNYNDEKIAQQFTNSLQTFLKTLKNPL